MEKIKIEKGTVQETLLIPLYGRKSARSSKKKKINMEAA